MPAAVRIEVIDLVNFRILLVFLLGREHGPRAYTQHNKALIDDVKLRLPLASFSATTILLIVLEQVNAEEVYAGAV